MLALAMEGFYVTPTTLSTKTRSSHSFICTFAPVGVWFASEPFTSFPGGLWVSLLTRAISSSRISSFEMTCTLSRRGGMTSRRLRWNLTMGS